MWTREGVKCKQQEREREYARTILIDGRSERERERASEPFGRKHCRP